MRAPPLIVIFGAAVRPDGRASDALLRRIGYGHAASEALPDAPILCSGGVAHGGRSEASVMAAELTARGVSPHRLILDEDSSSTLGNLEAAVRQLRIGSHPHIVACSDTYHLPRIRIVLAVMGVASRAGPVRRGPHGATPAHWVGMCLREAVAIPHTLAKLLARTLARGWGAGS